MECALQWQRQTGFGSLHGRSTTILTVCVCSEDGVIDVGRGALAKVDRVWYVRTLCCTVVVADLI